MPVEVNVVIPADTLFGDTDEPADVPGYGPVPADTARELVRRSSTAWLRRLFTRPDTSELIGMESKRRLFPPGQRRFITLRDQTCRTPWCDAPVRHIDHVVPDVEGGPTSVRNGQGLCEACNYAKEAPGWESRAPAGAHREVITRTPTGHEYRSRPPGRFAA